MQTVKEIIGRKHTLNDYNREHLRTGKNFIFERFGRDVIIVREVR